MTTTDDDLEQRLRATFHAVGAAAHPPDGLVERLHRAAADAAPVADTDSPRANVTPLHPLVHSRRQTAATRWAPLGAVAAVVAILAVGAGVAAVLRSPTTSPTPSSNAGGPVPWSAAGGRPTTETAPPLEAARATPGTRDCVSDDFTVVSGSSKPASGSSGWMVTTYTLASVATSPCAVTYYTLSAGLVDAQGTPLPVDRVPSGGGGHSPSEGPPRVDPGDLITGTATWAVVQGATNPPAELVVLPDNLVAAPRTRPPLAVSLTGVTIPPHPEDPSTGDGTPWRSTSFGNDVAVSQPGSLSSLTAAVTAPSSVRLGQLLTYTVELRNPTDDPVSLAACPEVIEVLSVVPQKEAISVGYRGPLNCAAAPSSIPPRGAVAFRMELATDGLVPGPGYVTWQLIANGRAVSNSGADITALP